MQRLALKITHPREALHTPHGTFNYDSDNLASQNDAEERSHSTLSLNKRFHKTLS